MPPNDPRSLTRTPDPAREFGLSRSQTHIFLGQARHPDRPLYNMAFAFMLEGELDCARFSRAWQHVIDHSDALRTWIDQREGMPVRQVRGLGACPLELLDVSSASDPDETFTVWALDRCRRVLPLNGNLVDSALVTLAPLRHAWYVNAHHLVTDAASTVLLFRRVTAAYAAMAADDPEAAIPPLTSYYQTAEALDAFPNATARAEAAAHWARRLEDHRSASMYGRSRHTRSTHNERLTVTLDAATSARLRQIASEPGFLSLTPDISMFAVFATVLASWLHRVTGQAGVRFDTPAQNRPTPAAKTSLGLFIEVFPFGVDVAPDDTFRLLGAKCLAQTQQFLRFALPGTSTPSAAHVSNVVLNFFPGAVGTFAGRPVRVDWIHPGHADSVHALRLQVEDFSGSGQFTLHFDLNEDAFPERLRRRAVTHFQTLLAAFVEDPDRAIDAVDILTDEERESLLVRFNETGNAALPSVPVTTLFERQASAVSHRIALRQDQRTRTFGDLRRDVDLAADALVTLGVRRGEPVAVHMRRSIEAVTAILAVLRAGAAYVPLDAHAPRRRLHDILEDCGARHVIVGDSHDSSLTYPGAATVRLADLLTYDGLPIALEAPRLDNLAYLIYTSGSTGKPKGVRVTHAGLADYLEWASREYVRGEQLTFPLLTSLAFDLTVTSLYLPVITGGTLEIYEEPDGPLDTSLMQAIQDNRVDVVKLTPSHLSLLQQLDLSSSRIRRMIVGGENLKTSLVARVIAGFGRDVEVYNEYGPTEAVVGCAIHRYRAATDPAASVPIGRPADHVRLYVLNEALSPVPEGVAGELCIARYGLAEGYHRREEATAQQFVADPFHAGDRMYRTGDLVRFVDPCTLEYLGRIDRQVKISGHRVEPDEIEAALLTHDAVEQCAVTVARLSAHDPIEPSALVHCERCGIASNVPGLTFDAANVCSVCRSFESIDGRAGAYFGSMHDLETIFRESAARRRPKYDCLVLLSGGKDSTYALCRLVAMGLRVYAFTLDNGYLSDQAKTNIARVVETLGVEHEFARTPAMNAIFKDSLARFSNVCNGCFKTIYTLAMARARERGIPIIVTGLSRGQFFETRLTPELFRDGRFSPAEVDAAVLAARRSYHRMDDEVARSLDVSMFQDDRLFEEVVFVDFYRYCDASLDDILSYLATAVPWMRPSDTGRSTNCRINEVGIYVHQKERGFHNYALPYSWDVRMGLKTRAEAMDELRDELDLTNIRRILREVGYDEDRIAAGADRLVLAAYVVASRDLSDDELRRHLEERVPAAMIPQVFRRIDAIPLTLNGKVDLAALSSLHEGNVSTTADDVAAEGPAEERIAAIWCDVLRVERVGARRSFFELGGTSLAAMEVMLRICNEFDVDLPLQTVFQHSTVAELAKAVEDRIVEEVASLSDEDAARLAADPDVST